MKLYLVHAGYYNREIMGGLYEQHTNYFVVANSLKAAKKKARLNLAFKKNKMHIDGIQEINSVDGYQINLAIDNKKIDSVIYSYNDVKDLSM